MLTGHDLYSFRLTSKAMCELVATPTPILDAALFRSSKAMSSSELADWRDDEDDEDTEVSLHLALAGNFFRQVILDSTFHNAVCDSSDLGVPGPAHRYRISRMKELGDCATSPAVSELRVAVWDTDAEQSYMERGWNYNMEFEDDMRDLEDTVVTVKNDDGRPVKLKQLLKKFFAALASVRDDLSNASYDIPYDRCFRHLRFKGWRGHAIDDSGILWLSQPEWYFNTGDDSDSENEEDEDYC